MFFFYVIYMQSIYTSPYSIYKTVDQISCIFAINHKNNKTRKIKELINWLISVKFFNYVGFLWCFKWYFIYSFYLIIYNIYMASCCCFILNFIFKIYVLKVLERFFFSIIILKQHNFSIIKNSFYFFTSILSFIYGNEFIST